MQDNWEADKEIVEKAYHKLALSEKENRHLRKRSEDYAVLEEVFDKPTLMTLYGLMNEGVFSYMNGVVSAGKEARVYWGVDKEGDDVAVKIYLVVAKEFRKRLQYIVGDPRFQRVRKGNWKLIELWARKEYRNLREARAARISVPNPIKVRKNIVVMQFIGEGGHPASLMNGVEVSAEDYGKLISIIKRLYRSAKLVHADLSEYNVFKSGKRLILFDFGSAVEISHPLSKEFLLRDIINVNRFFSKRGIRVQPADEVQKQVMFS